MAVHKCGWCGTTTHMTPYGPGITKAISPDWILVESPFKCDQCGRISVGSQPSRNAPNALSAEGMSVFWRPPRDPDTWAPQYVEGQDFPDVPEYIADAAGEAHKSMSIGNVKSAILMARTVVEATAKNKGITTGALFNKIDALAAANIIQGFTKDTAHAIRGFGNDMAHGDIEQPVDKDDAAMVLEFMDALLAEVFQNPAKLAALQARVAARKQP